MRITIDLLQVEMEVAVTPSRGLCSTQEQMPPDPMIECDEQFDERKPLLAHAFQTKAVYFFTNPLPLFRIGTRRFTVPVSILEIPCSLTILTLAGHLAAQREVTFT